jgi:hypothetical protein
MFHFPGISNFLGSPLCLWLHPHTFICCHVSAYSNCYTLLSLLDFLLKSGWKPPWHLNSWFLHVCKSSTMWMSPRTVTSFSTSQALLHPGYSSLWVLKHGRTFPQGALWEQMPCYLLSLHSLLKGNCFKCIYSLKAAMSDIWLIPGIPSSYLSYSPYEKSYLLFHSPNIFSSHTFLGPILYMLLFWANCKFSNFFTQLCAHNSHCKFD